MNIDWATAICGAAIGWVAAGKVDEAQQRFAQTISAGSAEGVKAAWKQAAKKAKAKAKKAGAGASKGTGKNA